MSEGNSTLLTSYQPLGGLVPKTSTKPTYFNLDFYIKKSCKTVNKLLETKTISLNSNYHIKKRIVLNFERFQTNENENLGRLDKSKTFGVQGKCLVHLIHYKDVVSILHCESCCDCAKTASTKA